MRGFTITPSTSPARAEGDKFFAYYNYNDTSGSLTIGMPVYLDVTDSGEFNVVNTTTAVTTGAGINIQTAGSVVLGTNSSSGANQTCVGVFQPDNTSSVPTRGSIIRVLVMGRGVISTATATGQTAVTVGCKVIASSTFVNAVAGTAAVGKTIATITATRGLAGAGNTIVAVPGSSQTIALVNGYVILQ